MNVPLVDLASEFHEIESEVLDAVARTIRSTRLINGPNVADFETEFSAFVGSPHSVAVNSGTDALVLALDALGIGPGDDVITVAHTFIATVGAIVRVGARPVLVDIDPETYTMCPKATAAAITRRTKALLPVHIYGQPADMEALGDLSRRHGLSLVEDCAQAHGATFGGRAVGTFGDAGCFSFYPSKNLGAYGEGGLVTTTREDVARQCRMLRNEGRSAWNAHPAYGYNSRMHELQAAVLRIKLRRLTDANERRRRAAAWYTELLADLPVSLPTIGTNREHAFHVYALQLEHRDHVADRLAARGVEVGFHYKVPVHLQPAAASLGYARGSLPVTEQLAERELSLPMHPYLTEEAAAYVATCLRDALAGC